jgi:hypothetical protein
MTEALLTMKVWWHDLSKDQRQQVLDWATSEGVPTRRTFALLFGEGRCTVFAYDEPLRMNLIRTGAVEAEPKVFRTKTPPPLDALRVVIANMQGEAHI